MDVTAAVNQMKLERMDRLLFKGEPNQWPNRHVFGGHIIAQACEAAEMTVDVDFHLHSFHSYFMRPGNAERDVIYDVDPIRDGRSFCTRRVVAIQNGEAIFSLSASYHKGERGMSHQIDMPDVPTPEELTDDEEYYAKALRALSDEKQRKRAELMFEMRSIDRMDLANPKPKDSVTGYWFKLKDTIEEPHDAHARLLAYCSDFALISSNMRPHAMIPRDPRLKTVASLDHAMWFHSRDFRVDDWVYYKTEGYWAGEGRGLARGALYRRDGLLIASTAQEGLMRLRAEEA